MTGAIPVPLRLGQVSQTERAHGSAFFRPTWPVGKFGISHKPSAWMSMALLHGLSRLVVICVKMRMLAPSKHDVCMLAKPACCWAACCIAMLGQGSMQVSCALVSECNTAGNHTCVHDAYGPLYQAMFSRPEAWCDARDGPGVSD